MRYVAPTLAWGSGEAVPIVTPGATMNWNGVVALWPALSET